MTKPEAMPDGAGAVIALAAEDLASLARLHDREPDGALLAELGSAPARNWFGLTLTGEDAAAGLALLDDYLAAAAASPARLAVAAEELSAEYANLYLTFGKRLAANESYWLTDDHIERQEPMFDVRGWYRHYGFAAENWRMRPDDHLVLQLVFVSRLLQAGTPVALVDAGRFLDKHLLRWSKDLFGGMARRADTPFYAGLALVSEAVLQTVRTVLVAVTGEERREMGMAAQAKSQVPGNPAFVPGSAPSW